MAAPSVVRSTGVAEAVNRLKGTFLEVPGTRLTTFEASRLCGLDEPVCGIVLEVLKDTGFLTVRPDGSFVQSGTEKAVSSNPR
jgi:hypothetical protein